MKEELDVKKIIKGLFANHILIDDEFILCYLSATMQTRKATLLTYMESLVIAPSLLFLLPLIWGLEGVWLSYPLTAILMLIFARVKKMR